MRFDYRRVETQTKSQTSTESHLEGISADSIHKNGIPPKEWMNNWQWSQPEFPVFRLCLSLIDALRDGP